MLVLPFFLTVLCTAKPEMGGSIVVIIKLITFFLILCLKEINEKANGSWYKKLITFFLKVGLYTVWGQTGGKKN